MAGVAPPPPPAEVIVEKIEFEPGFGETGALQLPAPPPPTVIG
jgi:hypothetical protein